MTGAVLVTTLAALPGLASASCEVPTEALDPFVTANGRLPAVDRLVGDAPSRLHERGIDIGGAYISEPYYNWGGLDEGGEYLGVLELYVSMDMKRLGLWDGLCFFANGYQIHGNSITGANIGSLMPVTSFEALESTRLFQLWFEQYLFNDRVSVRVGQLAADEEFFLSNGTDFFINGTWGWATIEAEDLPNGGPAYPLATPGVRVAIAPTDNTNLLIGVFNGDPAAACNKAGGDAQRCNPHGGDFRLRDSALLMVEGQYNYALRGGELPGRIKIGGWNHFGDFEDNRIDVGGNLIGVTGEDPKRRDGDYELYIILDQMLWAVPGGEEGQGIGFFTRFAGAPEDRNLVDFYFDLGLTFSGMVPGRPDDGFAIGYAYTGISDDVQAFNADSGEPVGSGYEALIEAVYIAEIMDGWTLQPNFQYIFNPEGGVEADDATVVGLRNTLAF
ncbi:MAG: carbohydrate porin [Methyloceanibacter sp.]|nr:carbohydrate porin [Methyloceanibacter sp.]